MCLFKQMMMYLRQSNRNKSSRKVWAAYGTIVCVVLFGFVLNRVAFMVGGPLWTTRSAIASSLDSVGSFFTSKSWLEDKINTLQKTVDEKDAEIITVKNQLELYSQLDAYVGMKEPNKNENIVRVVTRPPQTPFDILVIQTNNLVKEGSKVYYAGLPVGTIGSLVGQYARVTLLSHPDSQFRVLLGVKKNVGDAKGKGDGIVVVTMPKDTEAKEGDMVYLAEGTIPFGTISKIDQNTSQSFIDIYIKLPFSPTRVDWLSVQKE